MTHNKQNLILAIAVIITAIATLACSFAGMLVNQIMPVSAAESETASQDDNGPARVEDSSSQSNQTSDVLDSSQASVVENLFGELYLFSPIRSTDTYLMAADGTAMYTWPSSYTPGNSVYLLENGNLLRTGSLRSGSFEAGGSGGIVQEIAADGSVVWEYQYTDSQVQQHHDIDQMPNGNILMIAWERITQAEAILAGRDPSLLNDGQLWPDHIVELDPSSNQIVWEWHVWDHLVQEYDANKPNYGVIADHPELINLNHTNRQAGADWNHTNSIDYNAELDQILLSVHGFSEIWIIDHNTTSEQAAGAAGDLLYRWGNPQAYDSGSAADQQLYAQHDARWIPNGYPGGGNILVFNNGDRRTRAYSSVDEIVPPVNSDGTYTLDTGAAYGPSATTWSYSSPNDFYADHISGAQRLANGNTLICSGTNGVFFEVTPQGEMVWRYDYGGNVFRVTLIGSDYPGLTGLDLQAGEMLKAEAPEAGQTQSPSTGSGHAGPPQRALDACSGLAVGAACTIQNPNKTVSGSCQSIQEQLACVPTAGAQDAEGGAQETSP